MQAARKWHGKGTNAALPLCVSVIGQRHTPQKTHTHTHHTSWGYVQAFKQQRYNHPFAVAVRPTAANLTLRKVSLINYITPSTRTLSFG